MVKDEESKEMFKNLICNYILAVKEHLREGVIVGDLKPAGKYNVSDFVQFIHIPNRIMQIIYSEVNQLHVSGKISGEQLLFINNELQSFSDNTGACERIKKTPIPYSYNIFLKKIIFVYIASMPFGFAMEFGYWTSLIVPLLFYVFGSIELIAEEIEDPFGVDDNDLPTDMITSTIVANLEEIFSQSKV